MPTLDLPLDPRVQQSLRACYESLLKRGELLTKERLSECYALFRERFGPERLKSLDGEALLNTMHAHGSQDSLVYWLEFKSDAEFPTRQFGSISGGSALKFGLYKSKDSGEWMAGHPSNQTTLPIAEAIAKARKHRDQLVAAVAVIQDLPAGADDQAYLALQNKLDEVAPDVCRLAWGHKYVSLLFPDKLDDFHAEYFQRHNLIKLLQLPPAQPGLYVSAGRFVSFATQMGWPMNHLTAVLNERNGTPTKYWRIGTKLGEGNDAQDVWPDMKAGGYAANHWYLFAFDMKRDAMRTFALPRLKSPEITAERFTIAKKFNLSEYLKGSLAVFKGTDDYEVVVDFDSWGADLIRGRKWHASQEITELPRRQLRLRLRLNSIEEAERWVLSWGTHATVVRPQALANRLREIGNALQSRYQP